jgi:Kdo2-lipid IVA lauroyltransferase/acyltransferase
MFLIYLLPRKLGLFLAAKIGDFVYLILPKYRKIALENLTYAFGKEKTSLEISTIARKVFENLVKSGFELVQFPKINEKNIRKLVTLEGRENLDAGYAKGKGIVVITAHFGNWELMAASLRLFGCPGVTIGRRIYFHKYDRMLNYFRKVHDVNVIYRDDSPRKMLKVLKENRIVGVVADQDVDSVEGVFVDFFGRPAYTPSGPVGLARATGAALIPVVIRRNPDDTHTVIAMKEIELTDTGDKEKDLVENTKKWSAVIESYIRKYPEQWVWMHKRWKTKVA